MLDFVFVSYSKEDREFVQRLITDLQNRGVEIWIDKQGLKAGMPDWEQTIRDAIKGSKAVLLCASPNSRRSRYVKDELSIATTYGQIIFPVWIDGEHWIECIPMGFGNAQYIDVRGKHYSDGLHEIENALREHPAKKQDGIISNQAFDFEPRNPYKGLNSFTDEDINDFFGREKLVEELVKTIATLIQDSKKNARLFTILGASGAGKSSIILAGLLPKLRSGALPNSDKWIYLSPMVPGERPLERLAIALSAKLERSITSVLEDLDSDSSRGLHLLASALLKSSSNQVVIVVDQFEEIFTQTVQENERQHFIDLLVTAATEHRGPAIVILSLRADFYDRVMNYPELARLTEICSKAILPMDIEDLRNVIEKPAQLSDVLLQFEGGLVGDLLFEVRGQIGALPLLQFTLDLLYQHRDGHRLTLQAYREIGGVKGALTRHADRIFNALPSDTHRELIRTLFLRLIEPGSTEQDTTRRRASLEELILSDPTETQILHEIIDVLVQARLITANQVTDVMTIEVSHEALIREWSRLAEWIRDAREDIRIQKMISADTQEWIRSRRSEGYLYAGNKLLNAQAWVLRNKPTIEETNFIEASLSFENTRLEAEALFQTQFNNTREALAVDSTKNIAIIRAIADGVIVADANSYITQSNEVAEKLLDKSNDQLIGNHLDSLSAIYENLNNWKLAVENWKVAPLSYQIGHSLQSQVSLDDTRVISITLSPVILAERFVGTVSVIRDLTAQMELDRLKSQFVASVTHEIRTPITAIKLRAATLNNYYEQLTDEQRLDCVRRITHQSDILAGLIEDVLRLARLDSGQIDRQIELIDIVGIGRTVTEEFYATFEAAYLTFNEIWTRPRLPVRADITDFFIVWRNLIGNAIKYTNGPGNVTLCAGYVRVADDKSILSSTLPEQFNAILPDILPGGWVVALVKDTGKGISERDQAYLFTRFYRGEAAQTNVPGSGLGLSLVKELLDDYNGHISLYSRLGEGSTFIFWLPAAEEL